MCFRINNVFVLLFSIMYQDVQIMEHIYTCDFWSYLLIFPFNQGILEGSTSFVVWVRVLQCMRLLLLKSEHL